MSTTRQRCQLFALDPMGQLARRTLGWDEVVPAPRHMRGFAQPENAIGNRIAVMMVVKEPAIHVLLTKRSLDLFQVHELATEQSARRQHARLRMPRPYHPPGRH